jgi:hypothetical protein
MWPLSVFKPAYIRDEQIAAGQRPLSDADSDLYYLVFAAEASAAQSIDAMAMAMAYLIAKPIGRPITIRFFSLMLLAARIKKQPQHRCAASGVIAQRASMASSIIARHG